MTIKYIKILIANLRKALNEARVRLVCVQEGLNDDEEELIVSVVWAESGMRMDAINRNGDSSIDYGLCQYNSYWYIKKMKLITKEEAMTDWRKCVKLLIERYRNGSLTDWCAYDNGSYKRHLKRSINYNNIIKQ